MTVKSGSIVVQDPSSQREEGGPIGMASSATVTLENEIILVK